MPLTEILSDNQKQKRVWKRIHYLISISVLLILAVFVTHEFRHGDAARHQDWILNYGEKLIDHYEPVVLSALQNKNNDLLSLTLTTLNQQPVVIDATLFDATGQQISDQVFIPATQLLGHYANSSPQIFVRELFVDGRHLGYLRVTIDRTFLLKQNTPISQSQWQLLMLFSGISLIAGVFIGVKFRRRKARSS